MGGPGEKEREKRRGDFLDEGERRGGEDAETVDLGAELHGRRVREAVKDASGQFCSIRHSSMPETRLMLSPPGPQMTALAAPLWVFRLHASAIASSPHHSTWSGSFLPPLFSHWAGSVPTSDE